MIMSSFVLIVFHLCFVIFVHGDIYGSKEWIPQTRGAVWPQPQNISTSNDFFDLNPKTFRFILTRKCKTCDIIRDAVSRYKKILQKSIVVDTYGHKRKFNWGSRLKKWRLQDNYRGSIKYLDVEFTGNCTNKLYPSFDMDEEYTINITKNEQRLTSTTVWGILRGLESFSQLTYLPDDIGTLFINQTYIQDKPRFRHRGLLLDTSRHYIPKENILRVLDGMSYNKLNVFHWHLTDLQSFPYQSKRFPELSEKGAWNPNYAIYNADDVKSIIEYARKRGIRVVPEFDTPGHTASWGDSHKELLTACYEGNQPNGRYGPLDVSKNFTYTFVQELLGEVTQVFPDNYIHIGGDEVEFDCWQSNPEINDFMEKLNMTGDYVALESYYVSKVIDMVESMESKAVVWEEVFTNGVKIPQSTIVQVWKSDEDYKAVLRDVTAAGIQALLSSCNYLDVSWEWLDWLQFYQCDPTDFDGDDKQKELVLGGEIALWAEFVNEFNVETKLWPRAAPGAERLWSHGQRAGLELVHVAQRLEEHLCRLIKRGLRVEPASGPNYCL